MDLVSPDNDHWVSIINENNGRTLVICSFGINDVRRGATEDTVNSIESVRCGGKNIADRILDNLNVIHKQNSMGLLANDINEVIGNVFNDSDGAIFKAMQSYILSLCKNSS